MTRRSPGQQVVRRRLGGALRRLREQADVRVEAAARELECSPAKISRLENGLGPAKLWDVRILLDLYEVHDRAVRERFEEWARESKSVGWWESDADLTNDDLDRYFSVETDASRVRTYCTPVLHGLLQTREYGTAHTRTLFPDWRESEIDRFVQLRLTRQEALLREEDPLKLVAVLDEGAVRRQVGPPEVHAAQLAWLSDVLDRFQAAGRNNLSIRILPLSAGVPSRALGPFNLFEPLHPDLDEVSGYVEDTLGGSWLESDDVRPLIEIFQELVEMSLDSTSSREFLREIIRSL